MRSYTLALLAAFVRYSQKYDAARLLFDYINFEFSTFISDKILLH